jgi:hypothetical protein
MRTVTITAIAVVCVTSVLAAQATKPQGIQVPPQFQSAVNMAVEPPPGEAGWVLQVLTRGGIAGTARRIKMTSTGQLTCLPTFEPCAVALPIETVRQVAGLLAAIDSENWVPAAASLCSDCVSTLVVLHRREQGTVRIHLAHWDQSQTIAPPLRRLYELVTRRELLAGRPSSSR